MIDDELTNERLNSSSCHLGFDQKQELLFPTITL